ncbi:MAG TPA: NAD-dependent epimerase/dehydratase family protein [Ramlibacter sp.]|nr:NAD-dependent epimerase/dehydratase family protein [Ramlibacter sp.]
MRVLVLGGSGYVGARLCALLHASGWATPVSASSRANGHGALRVDTRDEEALTTVLQQVDAVINCVAGSADAITRGAAALTAAARKADFPRLVHLSSMAVYGAREGVLDEYTPLDGHGGWYARAKVEAEARMTELAADGASVTLLRPGCVWGPGSQLWVGRVARWLAARRLGDLGEAGDGWSNLVHVDDVCHAALLALRVPAHPAEPRIYNLAAPDSPRWNDYFADLALAIGATPLRRIRSQQLKLDAYLAGPPLHVARKLLAKAGRPVDGVPEPITPGLLALWRRHLLLDSTAASEKLGLQWMDYNATLRQSAAWILSDDTLPLQARLARSERTGRIGAQQRVAPAQGADVGGAHGEKDT